MDADAVLSEVEGLTLMIKRILDPLPILQFAQLTNQLNFHNEL